jgi:nitrite reductase/ring-hydroxylating ferredoxin subunit/uncharacterized membrane protein
MMPPSLTDAAVERIQSFQPLDSIGRKLSVWFAAVVRPGVFKDLLSGTWLGHPAHPMLTDVPIGAWTSAFALDLMRGEAAATASRSLIGFGVLAALPTAVTGLSELADIVDPEERSLGVAHAMGNVATVALYAASYWTRRRGRRKAGMALSWAGAAMATGAAYLGGHLVYRQVVGPSQAALDPRIADWTPVLDDEALPEAQPKRVVVDGTNVLLYREAGMTYALANRCSHRGGPLHKGKAGQGTVTCPWHLSTFRLEDGSIVRGPATAPQPAYDVRIRAGKIEIRSR